MESQRWFSSWTVLDTSVFLQVTSTCLVVQQSSVFHGISRSFYSAHWFAPPFSVVVTWAFASQPCLIPNGYKSGTTQSQIAFSSHLTSSNIIKHHLISSNIIYIYILYIYIIFLDRHRYIQHKPSSEATHQLTNEHGLWHMDCPT